LAFLVAFSSWLLAIGCLLLAFSFWLFTITKVAKCLSLFPTAFGADSKNHLSAYSFKSLSNCVQSSEMGLLAFLGVQSNEPLEILNVPSLLPSFRTSINTSELAISSQWKAMKVLSCVWPFLFWVYSFVNSSILAQVNKNGRLPLFDLGYLLQFRIKSGCIDRCAECIFMKEKSG
jgi:hypothetical protein